MKLLTFLSCSFFVYFAILLGAVQVFHLTSIELHYLEKVKECKKMYHKASIANQQCLFVRKEMVSVRYLEVVSSNLLSQVTIVMQEMLVSLRTHNFRRILQSDSTSNLHHKLICYSFGDYFLYLTSRYLRRALQADQLPLDYL